MNRTWPTRRTHALALVGDAFKVAQHSFNGKMGRV